jgi:hypothetical protein
MLTRSVDAVRMTGRSRRHGRHLARSWPLDHLSVTHGTVAHGEFQHAQEHQAAAPRVPTVEADATAPGPLPKARGILPRARFTCNDISETHAQDCTLTARMEMEEAGIRGKSEEVKSHCISRPQCINRTFSQVSRIVLNVVFQGPCRCGFESHRPYVRWDVSETAYQAVGVSARGFEGMWAVRATVPAVLRWPVDDSRSGPEIAKPRCAS